MTPPTLLDGWHVGLRFCLAARGFTLAVRAFMSFLRAFEKPAGKPYWSTFVTLFRGSGVPSAHKDTPSLVPDYWHPFILGSLEMLSYPVLIRTDNLHLVGAWLAFKALAQWKVWSDHRVAFNRFLIGNALVLLCSVLILAPMVHIDVKP